MTIKTLTAVAALATGTLFADNIAPKLTAYNENPTPENLAARELFQARGFGLFIHYGLYSVSGENEWQFFQDALPTDKYYADRKPFFKPKAGCVDEWIKLAKDAGMRYIVLTTRHHEGFWLGDDFIREYTTKVREAGLGVGVYFSVADWSDDGYNAGPVKDPEGWRKFVEKAHFYLRHLMTDFGKIEYLFYDGCPPPEQWDLAGINAEMRRQQPHLLICRGHKDCDFKSCEGNVAFDGAPLWEACYTFNHSWGYTKVDLDFKPLPTTADMFFSMRHNGGNFLLNVGPMADGTVQSEAVERLRALGKWVKANEEAIFDIVPHPFAYAPRELLTGRKGGGVAYWMCEKPRIRDGRVLCGIANKVNRVTCLATGEEMAFEQHLDAATPHIVFPKMKPEALDEMPRIFKIEYEGEPKGQFNHHLPKYAANDADELAAKIAKDFTVTGRDKFYGYDRISFDFKGHNAWICCPKGRPRKDMKWTWVMQWATAFVKRTNVPQMLDEGYHHVTIDTFEHRMDAEGLKVSADFQKYLVEKLGFAKKALLIGMSWGGFFSVRYAANYPENVDKAYLDAPLLCFSNFKVGIGPWEKCAPADGDWSKCPEMPVNMAERLAKAGIPVLLLYGGHDQTCVPALNAEPFEKAFRAAGGFMKTVKRGLYGHHPHGVEIDETTIKDFFERPVPQPVAKFDGEANAKNGWKLVASEEGKVVYIPFEGYYESKGGRIESPKFPLDKSGDENAWYSLTFTAKSEVDGYWWVDFFDKDGNLLPDVNSRLYASADWQPYDGVVPTRPEAVSAQVAFVSKKGAFAKDVTMRRISADEAATWCYKFYATLPRLDYAVPNDAWAKLPNAKTAIKVAKDFRIVFLGDSIMNDTWCGNFGAILQRDFPDTNLKMYLSVRGSTGCWYYHEKEHFDEYVAKFRPNLVVIGGISNWLGPKKSTAKEAEDWMVETIDRCKAIGAEVVVCTPPPSYEFRSDTTAKPFDTALCEAAAGEDYKYLRWDFHRNAAARTGVQLWDLTTGPANTISRSGKPLDWFKRDAAHNDDRGKQIITMAMGEFFRAAYR